MTLLALFLLFAVGTSLSSTIPKWRNWSLPFQERAEDLIKQLTQEEKLSQFISNSPSIPRLNISAYSWGNECLHGIKSSLESTVFPQPIGMAASFDLELIEKVGAAISDEARAANNIDSNSYGLDCWSPNMNIFRDPRWGRGSETYGEDPFLTSQMIRGLVAGMQQLNDGNHYVKLIATCKHFLGYSLEEWEGIQRHEFDANISTYDMMNTYLPAFAACVSARVGSVMCSYNSINGIPACGNHQMLQQTLRDQFGFEGYVVSDCGAIDDIWRHHKYVKDKVQAVALAINSGTDLDCGSAYKSLPEAVQQGLVNMSVIDRSLKRLLLAKFRLGIFDPKNVVPYKKIPPSHLCSKNHTLLAEAAARDSLVLLKNDGILPLNPAQLNHISVIGPSANDTEIILGNYHGTPQRSNVVTPLEGITNLLSNHSVQVHYSLGAQILGEGTWMFDHAVEAAQKSDVVLIFVGLSMEGTPHQSEIKPYSHIALEKESLDRTSLILPSVQTDLIKAIRRRCDNEKKIVVVLLNGGPLAVEWEFHHANALVEAFYGGQAAGTAIAEMLFGKYSPSGRMPVTIYKWQANYVDQISMGDMSMTNWPGRTYRYLQVMPLFEFGFGLGYSEVEYHSLDAKRQSAVLSLNVLISNRGRIGTDHSVLVFAHNTDQIYEKRRLIAFKKERDLNPSEQRNVKFVIDLKQTFGIQELLPMKVTLTVGPLRQLLLL